MSRPIGILGDNPNIYAYTYDVNRVVDPFGLMPIRGGQTEGGMDRLSEGYRNRYDTATMRKYHLVPQAMLNDESFMRRFDNLTGRNGGIDYLHRQISIIPNELHNNVHSNGWNNQFKDWFDNNPNFTLKDLQTQVKSMMKDFNIPKSSRNFAKRY